MRLVIRSYLPLLGLLLPGALAGQGQIPAQLAEVEAARSRACVGPLADLAALEASLEPFALRADRLNQMGRAVTLEKRQDAEPFDLSSPVEASVSEWFSTDSVLAVRFIEEGDSAILAERTAAREGILTSLRETIQGIQGEAQVVLEAGAPAQAAAEPCVGAILVRSAVLEECGSTSNPVCEAAGSEERQGPYVFVEAPVDLWGVEEYGPWDQPTPLQLGPSGEVVGARTSARARIGNVTVVVGLRPLLTGRADLGEEELAQYQANLDSLGIAFDHPTFTMAPGLDVQGTLPPPLGGETHYILHFGDLTGDDVIWSVEAGTPGPFRAVFPARQSDLARLRTGELVSLSAIRAPEQEGQDAQAIFTLSLFQVGQEANVGLLMDYFTGGGFDRDFKVLFPTGSEG